MKVLGVEYTGEIQLEKIPRKHWWNTQYWRSIKPWSVVVLTTESNYRADIAPGWVTDRRSGSSFLDFFIPKKGNSLYQAGVNFHDFCYSGHLKRDIADEILRQVMVMSTEVSETTADVADYFVDEFGESHYYPLDKAMPTPYTKNRLYEHFTITG